VEAVDTCVQTVFHDGLLLFENIEESEAADAYVQNHLPSLYRLCPDISPINSSINYSFLHSEILIFLSQSYVLRVLRKIVIF
jgi:hypothetical protein